MEEKWAGFIRGEPVEDVAEIKAAERRKEFDSEVAQHTLTSYSHRLFPETLRSRLAAGDWETALQFLESIQPEYERNEYQTDSPSKVAKWSSDWMEWKNRRIAWFAGLEARSGAFFKRDVRPVEKPVPHKPIDEDPDEEESVEEAERKGKAEFWKGVDELRADLKTNTRPSDEYLRQLAKKIKAGTSGSIQEKQFLERLNKRDNLHYWIEDGTLHHRPKEGSRGDDIPFDPYR